MVIASQRLLQEVCDEKRFGKLVEAGLKELRNGIRKNCDHNVAAQNID